MMWLDRLEQRINKENESSWKWLDSFDPPQKVRKDWRYFKHAWLPIIIPMIIVVDLVISIAWIAHRVALPSVSHFASYCFFVILSSFILLSPLFLVVSCLAVLPSIWAWNRRAARLQKEPEPVDKVSYVPTPEGVWPPAPRR